MKQAFAFGVDVVVATQNPMDLDYRAFSNAGLWSLSPQRCVGPIGLTRLAELIRTGS